MIENSNTVHTRLAVLMEKGAAHFDPAGIAYVRSLIHRARNRRQSISRILERKAAAALDACQSRFEKQRAEIAAAAQSSAAAHPESAKEIHDLFEKPDKIGLRRLIQQLERKKASSPLSELTRQLYYDTQSATGALPSAIDDILARQKQDILRKAGLSRSPDSQDSPGANASLRAVHLFRETWKKLHADRQMMRALNEQPENAGPLNSQMLLTRSLYMMRSLSPEYLNRFIMYADTLLWLEQAGKTVRPRSGKK